MASTERSPSDVRASLRMAETFWRETTDLAPERSEAAPRQVSEADLAALPPTARRYFDFMGSLGAPYVTSLRAHVFGRFRRHPLGRWAACETWLASSRDPVARVFHMRLRLGGVLPMYIRDTYRGGRGRMLGKVFDAFAAVDEDDEKVAIGELVTYVNDAILLAPSLLLGAEATIRDVDDHAFEVAFADAGRAVRARVTVDARGAVRDFETSDRFGQDPDGGNELVRARWSTPIAGWTMRDRVPRPTTGRAVWHFPTGDFDYVELDFAHASIEVGS